MYVQPKQEGILPNSALPSQHHYNNTHELRSGYLRPAMDTDFHRYVANSLNYLLEIINNKRNINEIQKIIHPPRQREHILRLGNYIKAKNGVHSLGKYTLFSPIQNCYEVCATLYKSQKMIALVGRMEKVNNRFAWKEIQILNS